MDRRKFCLSSAAAAVSGAAAGLACLPAAGQMPPAIPAAAPVFPLYRFIYDRRYPAARAFGTAANGMRSAPSPSMGTLLRSGRATCGRNGLPGPVRLPA